MGLPRTVSEINDDFSQKSQQQKFPTPMYFAPSLNGFPLELGVCDWSQKTRMTGLPGWQICLRISSAMWIQYTNVTDRRTDRHRTTANQITHWPRRSRAGRWWLVVCEGTEWDIHTADWGSELMIHAPTHTTVSQSYRVAQLKWSHLHFCWQHLNA